jgi:transposase
MSQHAQIHLTSEQRHELEAMLHKGQSPARVQTRARILLLSDRSQGAPRKAGEIAQVLLCSESTVGNIRRRFAQEGLQAALYDKPRPGAKPKLTGDVEAQLITLACSAPPEGQSRWTLRLLAQRLVELEVIDSVSHVAVRDVLKKTNLSLGA